MTGADTDLFTLADAAALLGKKTDTLKKWFANGCPHQKEGAVYQVRIRDVFDWRLQYERELLSGGDDGPGEFLNLEQERAKLARAQTEAAEIANAVKRGELVAAVEVERAWAAMVASCKAKLRGLGTKVVARLAVPRPREVAASINVEIDRALFELASNADDGTGVEDVEAV